MAIENERFQEGQIIGAVLRFGAYGSMVLIALGLSLILAYHHAGDLLVRAGFLLLMFTPAVRIIVAGVMFIRQRDYKYALVSVVVLAVLVGTSVLAMKGLLPQGEK